MSSTLVFETVVKLTGNYEQKAAQVQRAARTMGNAVDDARVRASRPIATASRMGMSGAPPVQKPPIQGGGGGGGEFLPELRGAIPGVTEIIGVLKILTGAALAAGAGMFYFGVRASLMAGEFEALRASLVALTGSAEEADRQISRLREVARLPGLGFEEAVRGSARLQAVGFDARLAERALMAFGNAVALVGGGREELEGVSMAMMQIAAKGKVSAEEILQLQERIPQIRAAMIAAFGTADTEVLSKMGISASVFLPRIIDELEKLPKAAGTAKNAWENLADAANTAMVSIGTVINSTFAPAIEELGNFINYASRSGLFADVAARFLKAGHEMLGMGSKAARMGLTGVQSMTNNAPPQDLIQRGLNAGATDSIGAIDFVMGAENAGDALVRAASLVVSGFTLLPTIAGTVFQMAQIAFDKLKLIVEDIIAKVVALFERLSHISLEIGGVKMPIGFGFGDAKPDPSAGVRAARMERLDKKQADLMGGLQKTGGAWTDLAQDIYNGFKNDKPTNQVGDDPNKGNLTDMGGAAKRTAKATEALLALEQKRASLEDRILNGGGITHGATSPLEIRRLNGGGGGGGGSRKAERLMWQLMAELGQMMDDRQIVAGRLTR